MKQLLATLLALIAQAIRTQREDHAKVADIKTQVDELDLEDDHKDQVNEVINLSLAARPPTEEQVSLVGKGPLSQDPAQPPGTPAPGDPEVEKEAERRKAAGEVGQDTEEEEDDANETPENKETAKQLEAGNTHDELVKLAADEEIEINPRDSKGKIAKAIVKARKAK